MFNRMKWANSMNVTPTIEELESRVTPSLGSNSAGVLVEVPNPDQAVILLLNSDSRLIEKPVVVNSNIGFGIRDDKLVGFFPSSNYTFLLPSSGQLVSGFDVQVFGEYLIVAMANSDGSVSLLLSDHRGRVYSDPGTQYESFIGEISEIALTPRDSRIILQLSSAPNSTPTLIDLTNLFVTAKTSLTERIEASIRLTMAALQGGPSFGVPVVLSGETNSGVEIVHLFQPASKQVLPAGGLMKPSPSSGKGVSPFLVAQVNNPPKPMISENGQAEHRVPSLGSPGGDTAIPGISQAEYRVPSLGSWGGDKASIPEQMSVAIDRVQRFPLPPRASRQDGMSEIEIATLSDWATGVLEGLLRIPEYLDRAIVPYQQEPDSAAGAPDLPFREVMLLDTAIRTMEYCHGSGLLTHCRHEIRGEGDTWQVVHHVDVDASGKPNSDTHSQRSSLGSVDPDVGSSDLPCVPDLIVMYLVSLLLFRLECDTLFSERSRIDKIK